MGNSGPKTTKLGRIAQERRPLPDRTLIGIPVVALVVSGIERSTHSDALAALATLVIMGAYLGWWFWRHRYL